VPDKRRLRRSGHALRRSRKIIYLPPRVAVYTGRIVCVTDPGGEATVVTPSIHSFRGLSPATEGGGSTHDMVDKAQFTEVRPVADGAPPATTTPPKRSPGHRGADVRDTVAEMAAKAQEISQEAGSKMAAAMKDVISAAAGLSGFAIESARDLVQYMVRRGQMTQEEADKLIREAEVADAKRNPHPVPPPSRVPKPPPPPRPDVLVAAPVPTGMPRPSGSVPRSDFASAPAPVTKAADQPRPLPGKVEPPRVVPVAKKVAPAASAPKAKKKAAAPPKPRPSGKVPAKKKATAKR